MNPIKIESKNAEKIEAALKFANADRSAHAYTTYREVERIAERAEFMATNLLGAKSSYRGAVFISTSGESVPRSYKYSRIGR